MKKNILSKIVFVLGPTASGKTDLAIDLAKKFNGEIINADSRQIYKKMNIGTAKPDNEASENSSIFIVDGVVHHLMDIVNPDEEFTLAHFKSLAIDTINNILKRGKLPIVAGGTGLYLWSIIDNLDIPKVAPNLNLRKKLEAKSLSELVKQLQKLDLETAEKIDLKNQRRVVRALEIVLDTGESFSEKQLPPIFDVLQIGILIDREKLIERINSRVDIQIDRGLTEEVVGLSKKYSWNLPAMSSIGYKQIGYYIRDEIKLSDAIELIKRDTRRYAKRQMSWFRRDKRIKWIESKTEAEELVAEYLL